MYEYRAPSWCHRFENQEANSSRFLLERSKRVGKKLGSSIPINPSRITRVRVLVGGEAKRAPRQVATRARRRSINVYRRSVKQCHVASIIDGNPSSA